MYAAALQDSGLSRRRTSRRFRLLRYSFRCALLLATGFVYRARRAHFARGEPYGDVPSLFTGPSVPVDGGRGSWPWRSREWLASAGASDGASECLLELA
jgi:hypothetical protein